jgi:hypothetical protein
MGRKAGANPASRFLPGQYAASDIESSGFDVFPGGHTDANADIVRPAQHSEKSHADEADVTENPYECQWKDGCNKNQQDCGNLKESVRLPRESGWELGSSAKSGEQKDADHNHQIAAQYQQDEPERDSAEETQADKRSDEQGFVGDGIEVGSGSRGALEAAGKVAIQEIGEAREESNEQRQIEAAREDRPREQRGGQQPQDG